MHKSHSCPCHTNRIVYQQYRSLCESHCELQIVSARVWDTICTQSTEPLRTVEQFTNHRQISAYVQCLCQCLCVCNENGILCFLFVPFFHHWIVVRVHKETRAHRRSLLLLFFFVISLPCTQSYGKTAQINVDFAQPQAIWKPNHCFTWSIHLIFSQQRWHTHMQHISVVCVALLRILLLLRAYVFIFPSMSVYARTICSLWYKAACACHILPTVSETDKHIQIVYECVTENEAHRLFHSCFSGAVPMCVGVRWFLCACMCVWMIPFAIRCVCVCGVFVLLFLSFIFFYWFGLRSLRVQRCHTTIAYSRHFGQSLNQLAHAAAYIQSDF